MTASSFVWGRRFLILRLLQRRFGLLASKCPLGRSERNERKSQNRGVAPCWPENRTSQTNVRLEKSDFLRKVRKISHQKMRREAVSFFFLDKVKNRMMRQNFPPFTIKAY